ncbi:MAG: class I SAM-dependent methyltransferase [Aliidongia sp.]
MAGSQLYRETEYDDGGDYDLRNPWSADDDFFLALAKRVGGPVLDLGCGTGRLARGLSGLGLEVTALDAAPAMLARARALDPAGTIRYLDGDVRRLRLDRRYRLALMTAHGFQHLLTAADQTAALERIAAHLMPDGCFAFDLRNLAAQDFTQPGLFRHSSRFVDGEGCHVAIEVAPHWDAITGIATYFLRRRAGAGGVIGRSRARLRYSEPAALDRLLAAAGFVVAERYGDWPDAPFEATSPEIITISRLAGSSP